MPNSEPPPPARVTGEPVPGFPIKFTWQTGDWFALFQKHVELIQADIKRAVMGGRQVLYLSCPISSYGGSFSTTNVEIALFTAQRLSMEFGSHFWFLNPAQYQMESQLGLGLIRNHARELELENPGRKVDVDKLMKQSPASGGDYMRMWTRVLVEDDCGNFGGRFSAFYFIGAADMRKFFANGETLNISAAVEQYFARKMAMDHDFSVYFTPPFTDPTGKTIAPADEQAEWTRRRDEFIRFYSLKASAAYSRGSHDEWNIWRLLNENRRASANWGLGEQLGGYYGGTQIEPQAAETPLSKGYAI
jgi:hypothetical protein